MPLRVVEHLEQMLQLVYQLDDSRIQQIKLLIKTQLPIKPKMLRREKCSIVLLHESILSSISSLSLSLRQLCSRVGSCHLIGLQEIYSVFVLYSMISGLQSRILPISSMRYFSYSLLSQLYSIPNTMDTSPCFRNSLSELSLSRSHGGESNSLYPSQHMPLQPQCQYQQKV